ncbi:Nramp family divalent metal transporter [Actinomycetospora sp. NBRC 106378]|uniref:Nramp family divalent metal transporter n=1 Tax=Actinomycetospora sp. NBRC 106378 TaxID=3032208 RepID=UPI0024A1F025|nr:divalent metal cation transporter MntH [Actinomycetospora sp. NBRC 106378]
MFRRPPVALAGPAFIASVAYVDPGNVATNSVAGATSGYALAWVVVGAGLMAMPVQYVAAKVGIASGRSVPRAAKETMSRPLRVFMWLQAEIVAMATDVAEFLGAAVGLQLLFGLGLLESGLITAAISFAVLALQRRGHRPFEVGIITFLAFIVAGVAFQVVSVGVDPGGLAGGLVPGLADSTQLVLAVGIVGATVMPHAIYAHSALTAGRTRGLGRAGRARLLGFQRTEVVAALSVASLVNLAMLLVAAGAFGGTPAAPGVDGLEAAHAGLGQIAGGAVALAFAATLLASGLSSAAVGTYSGQVVMEGFVDVRLPLLVRRFVTMLPALVLLAVGVSPTAALVGSQVVLCFGIPFALYALLRVARDRQLLGDEAIGRPMQAVLGLISAVVITLNVVLIVDTVAG